MQLKHSFFYDNIFQRSIPVFWSLNKVLNFCLANCSVFPCRMISLVCAIDVVRLSLPPGHVLGLMQWKTYYLSFLARFVQNTHRVLLWLNCRLPLCTVTPSTLSLPCYLTAVINLNLVNVNNTGFANGFQKLSLNRGQTKSSKHNLRPGLEPRRIVLTQPKMDEHSQGNLYTNKRSLKFLTNEF